MGEMRRISQHERALAQRGLHQTVLVDVQVRGGGSQVADASMRKFSGSAGGVGCEVVRLDEDGSEAAKLGVERAPRSGGSAADNADIERGRGAGGERFAARS